MERFVEQHALKNVHNVPKNVSVLLNGTVHTQTHVNAQCDVIAGTKYRRCRGRADFITAHVSECSDTITHVVGQIARNVERFAS